MPAVCRVGVDSHIGHASVTPNPFHASSYTSTPQTKVTVEGSLAVVVGGSTGCGDGAVGGSSKVNIQGSPVHRVGDGTSGHGSWLPNAAASGSPKVIAGG